MGCGNCFASSCGNCFALGCGKCFASLSCNAIAFLGVGCRASFSHIGEAPSVCFSPERCRCGVRCISPMDTLHVESVFVPQIHGAKITFFGFVKRCKTVVCVVLQICGEDFSSFYEKVW